MDAYHSTHLEEFLQDIPFPIDKQGLVLEALDSPLPQHIKDAISLLPDREYSSRRELKEDLLGIPDDPAKKEDDEIEDEEEKLDDELEHIGEELSEGSETE